MLFDFFFFFLLFEHRCLAWIFLYWQINADKIQKREEDYETSATKILHMTSALYSKSSKYVQ